MNKYTHIYVYMHMHVYTWEVTNSTPQPALLKMIFLTFLLLEVGDVRVLLEVMRVHLQDAFASPDFDRLETTAMEGPD